MSQSVFLVDDDRLVRESVQWLLQTVALPVRAFADGESFLAAYAPGEAGCVVMDVRMPGINGMELHKRLKQIDAEVPVIIVTGHADVPMAIRAMKEGAFDFLEKPYNDQQFLERVQAAMAHHRTQCAQHERIEQLERRFDSLTAREQEVLAGVLWGEPNKRIAQRLKIAVKTVELHRQNLMNKLDVHTPAELVRLAIRAGRDVPGKGFP